MMANLDGWCVFQNRGAGRVHIGPAPVEGGVRTVGSGALIRHLGQAWDFVDVFDTEAEAGACADDIASEFHQGDTNACEAA